MIQTKHYYTILYLQHTLKYFMHKTNNEKIYRTSSKLVRGERLDNRPSNYLNVMLKEATVKQPSKHEDKTAQNQNHKTDAEGGKT